MTAGFCLVGSGQVGVVQRSGRYRRTVGPGLTILVPFLDRATVVDTREQVISCQDTAVVTTDELLLTIDWSLYLTVTDARAVTVDRPRYLSDLELLTSRTLREVVGAMHMEQALTSRAEINSATRRKLQWGTGDWGVELHRLEIRDLKPPAGFTEALEAARADKQQP